MQSHHRSKPPAKLPWGFGSMAFHGKVWWLIYRTPDGKIHYENSGTADAGEAQRIMAGRALPRARAMVEALEAIADGKPDQAATEAEGGGKARDGAQHGASRGSVRHDAAVGGDGKTTPRGGKR